MTAPKRRINVKIKVDGSIVFAPSGYTGAKCKDATKHLERAFGGATKTKATTEMNQQEIEKAKVSQGGGGE